MTTLLAEEEKSNFLIPNGTFFVELIIFLVVLGVIAVFVVPPIRDVLQARADRIAKTADDQHKAARAFNEAEAKYKAEIRAARSDAAKIRDEARAEGQKILDDMRSRARAEADAISRKAAEQLQAQADAAAAQVRSQINPLADQLTGRVLGMPVASQSGRS
ncbi:F0F1 ATP synthase subunit B [Smaragdicoccus niigatensis]|uniref:F0F1 ATP synthase subunit B n=1 Tax=Smaragdicoccus niigatensis TaxID=359359 RepID=UPI000361E2B3|nr:F0F1 ATP synthase subunit B [Smaragdicoccus niigatensis]